MFAVSARLVPAFIAAPSQMIRRAEFQTDFDNIGFGLAKERRIETNFLISTDTNGGTHGGDELG